MTPLPCRQCAYYIADTSGKHGQCHGLPPATHGYRNANEDFVLEQSRPLVASMDTGCSLFRQGS